MLTLVEPKAFTNDVLLSSAEDTHAGFAGHVLNTLQQRGFRTLHRQELEREAITQSMIFIIILSGGYPSFPSRLDKLAEIVDELSKGRKGRWLLPVFYNTGPFDVLRRALAVHKNRVEPERLENWTKALTKVAVFPGFYSQRDGDTCEYECIEEILLQVSKHVACTVGLNPRVMEVIRLLHSGSDDGVHVIGMCGVPGIGKKTIARGVYDLIVREGFDSYCFLDNVGENLRKHGLVHLPRMLLSEMVGNNYKFGNVDAGMSVLKRTLNRKKVFIIFEGVNHPEPLKAVVELTNWFGSRSIVIITGRDKCLFESHGIKRMYEVQRLDRVAALHLLSLKVFNSMNIKGRDVNILHRAETCASGHPLTLKVIGSNLGGKTIKECESVLDKYEKIPNKDLIPNIVRENNRLQLSEDILSENMEYGKRDAPPASNDRRRIWDPMELEYQLCSSSSSQDAL